MRCMCDLQGEVVSGAERQGKVGAVRVEAYKNALKMQDFATEAQSLLQSLLGMARMLLCTVVRSGIVLHRVGRKRHRAASCRVAYELF